MTSPPAASNVRSAPTDILRTWLSRPVAVSAWAAAILIAGSWAALRVPLEWVPQLELAEVRIAASWPGASPRSVERYVTAPIERAVQSIPGTQSVESLSEEGTTSIILSVSDRVDLAMYVAQVGEQLTLLRHTLPDRVHPQLTKRVPDALRAEQGFMTLQLLGPGTADELRALAEERLAPRLRSLEDVADVRVEGGSQRELLVELDPGRLSTFGISAAAVQMALAGAFDDQVFGRLTGRGESVLLFRPSEDRVAEIQRLVVRPPVEGGVPVRLADIATVERGPAPLRSISRIDGQNVISLTIERTRGSHMLQASGSVISRVEELREMLPENARLLVADDRSESVREELNELTLLGGLGLVLVVLVLLFMLRGVRAAAVVLFSVGVALSAAIWLLGPLDLTLNLLTIAGLVLVFGLLVDNSVVMTEQILLQRQRLAATGRRGIDLDTEATAEALRAVWIPLLGGTLSTMVVVLPLLYLSGELRSLFLPFGVLVALTLGTSLLSAALLVPVLARYLPPPESHRRNRFVRRASAAPFRVVARFPKVSLLVLALILGVPLWLLPASVSVPEKSETDPHVRLVSLYNDAMGSEPVRAAREKLDPALGGVTRPFFRDVDFGQRWSYDPRPEVSVTLRFPPGNPIERADELIATFEREALGSESVSRTIVRVTERFAQMRVQFYDGALRDAEPYLLRERLIGHATRLAGITVSVGGLLPQGYFSGSGMNISGFVVEAYGPNYEDLEALTESLAERLRRNPRVATVNTNAGRFGFADTREVLRFRWSADAALRSGASASDVASALRPIFATRFPIRYTNIEDDVRIPVRLTVQGAEVTDVASIAARPLMMRDSSHIQLASLAPYDVHTVPGAIERSDQQYKRYVSIDYRGPHRMGDEFITAQLQGFTVPTGYRVERQSMLFFTEETTRSVAWVLLATLGLVFLIIAAVFNSWKLPLVVMLSVPLAGVGVGAGFLWSGANFAEGAFIGVVLLVGIAVNDSILLTYRFRQHRMQRPSTSSALLVRLAVRERLRPMWATTLTTSASLLPLIIFPSGGDFWLGLAVTVTGGLIAATLLAPPATVAMLSDRLGVRPTQKVVATKAIQP